MRPTVLTVPCWVRTAASLHEFREDDNGAFWVRRCPGEGPGPVSGLPATVSELPGDGEFLPLLDIQPVLLGWSTGWLVVDELGPVQRWTTAVVEVLWRDGRHERLGAAAQPSVVDADGSDA